LRSLRASGPAPDPAAPFGACGRDMGAHDRGVEHLNQVGRLAHGRESIKEGLEHPGLAQAPEARPNRVPVPELCRERAPGDVVDAEIVQRFEKQAVIPAFVAPPRATGSEYLNHPLPVLVRHPRQHGRPPHPTSQEAEIQSEGNQLSNLLNPIRPHGLESSDSASRSLRILVTSILRSVLSAR